MIAGLWSRAPRRTISISPTGKLQEASTVRYGHRGPLRHLSLLAIPARTLWGLNRALQSRNKKYYLPASFLRARSYSLSISSPKDLPSSRIDWTNIEEMNVEDIPEPLTDEELRQEEKFWANFTEEVKKMPTEYDFSEFDTAQDTSPIALLRRYPLMDCLPEGMSMRRAEIMVGKALEVMAMELRVMNLQAAFDQFMEVRMNGLVPSQEMYEHFFSIVAVWGDNEAMDLLLEEMDKLGYQKGQVIDTNLVMRAVTEGETEVAEKLFEEMRKKKYDIPEKYYNIMLMYYSRIALDFEKAWALYGAMRKDNVIVGPNPGNVLLDLCRIDKNWDRAEELFEEMLRCGDLTSDKSKDFDTLVFETTTYKSFPKLHTITDTYLLMTEIYCEKGDLQKAEEFLQKTRETIKLAERKNNALHTRFYTSLMQLYLQNKQYDKVQKTLEEVLESGTYPPLIIWKKAFQAVLRKNNPKEVIKFNEEFENHGYEFDEELSGELIDFWASVKDYRRAKNTYDSLLKLGILPSDEARSAIIKVYAVAGYEGEVQRFYEDQVRTGRRITASMHEVMVDDFLKRGYPGSARQVLVRMEVDGLYPTAGVIAKVVSGYADVGGSKQIGELFKQYFTGPEAKLSMTGEMLAAAVKGCIKDSDVNYALDLWEKYSRRILLTYDVAEALIYNFAQLKALETAFEIYKRLKSERQFKPDDPSSLFDTILSVANTAEKCRAVLQDMRDSFIPISTDSIRAVLTNPEVVVDLPFVLEIVKIYITEAFPGPYEREIFMLFFGLVEKYDYGRFKAEARAWLQRLSPPRPDGVFILDSNKKDESLLTSRVSLLLSKYILAIDTTQFVIPAANKKPLDALFTGSILDVEDLLVHKYGFDPTAVRQLLGDDKEEVAMREYLKGLDKKIEESQKKDNRAEE